jgi:tRNA threonylcarbamoyladenosine biosynthesis protein TsaE
MGENTIQLITESEDETLAVGWALADWLRDGDVLLLHGDLGAGKTTLTKGIAAGLRVPVVVTSPSFALVNEYDAGLTAPVSRLYHLDLFRLDDSDDLASIGFADLSAPADGVTIVEWPERALDALPSRYLLVEIEHAGPERRSICIRPAPDDATWAGRIAELRARLDRVPD